MRNNSKYAKETGMNQFEGDIHVNVSKWVFVRNGASNYSSACLTSRRGFIYGFNGEA